MMVALSARGQALTRREVNVLRMVLAVLCAVFLVVGVVGFMDLVREPEHSFQDASLGFVAFGALCVGGATYGLGVALWSGAGFRLRVAGWLLMVPALALPSPLTLGLPLACTLAAGLQRSDQGPAGRQTGPSRPSPRRRLERQAH